MIRHYISYLLLIFIVNFVVSCSKEQDKIPNEVQIDLDQKITFPLQDTDYYSAYCEVFEKNDSTYLMRENHIFANMQIYNLSSKSLYRTVEFQEDGPNGIKNGVGIGFIPFDLDSMYLINNYNGLFLMKNDSILEKHDISFMESNPVIGAHNERKLIKFNDSLFGMAQYKPFAFYTDEFMQSSVFALFNKNSGDMSDASITFPSEIYSDKCWVPQLLRPSYTFNEKSQRVVFSFPADHNLYEYDYQKDSLVTIKQEPNKFFAKVPSYDNCKQDRPMQDYYTMSTPHYFSMIYDSVQRVYFRFFLMPPDEIGVREVSFVKKRLGVIVLNENYRVINQTLFEEYQFLPKDFFIDDEGLWVSNNNPENELFEEDKIKYTLLKIRKDEE